MVGISPFARRCMMKHERLKEYYFSDKDKNLNSHNDYYFLSRNGRRLTVEALERIFKQANQCANVRDAIRCSPHTARHYFAQAQLRNGNNVYNVSRLLGHENINITKRYLQSLQDDKIIEMSIQTSPLMNLK